MRQPQRLALALFVPLLSALPARCEEPPVYPLLNEVNVTTLNPPLLPNDGQDDGLAFYFHMLNASDDTIYYFPAGVYDVTMDNLVGGWVGTVVLAGKKNVTLRGLNGTAQFVWHGFDPAVFNGANNGSFFPGPGGTGSGGFFLLSGCENIKVENFCVDMSRPANTWGWVIDRDNAAATIDVLITDSSVHLPENATVPSPIYVVNFNQDKTLKAKFHARPKSQSVVTTGPIVNGNQVVTVEFSPFWVQNGNFASFAIDDRLNMSHQRYQGNAFTIVDCTGTVTIRDSVIKACAGMGVRADESEDIVLDNLDFVPTGSGVISSASDGINLGHCTGDLTVVDCDLVGNGDDSFAFYRNWSTVISATESTPTTGTVLVESNNGPFRLFQLKWNVGDTIELRSADFGTVVGTADVVVIQADPEPGDPFPYTVTIDNASASFFANVSQELIGLTAPSGLPAYRPDWLPDSVLVETCTSSDNLGRGLLVEIPNTTARFCTFTRSAGPGILATATMSYNSFGGPGPSNLLVEDCKLIDSNVGAEPGNNFRAAAIRIYGEYMPDPVGFGSPRVFAAPAAFQNLTFRRNQILTSRVGGATVRCCTNLVFDQNYFVDVSQSAASFESFLGTAVSPEEDSLIFLSLINGGAVTSNSAEVPYNGTLTTDASVTGVTVSGNLW